MIAESGQEIRELVEACRENYSDEFDTRERHEVEIDDSSRRALTALAGILGADAEPDDIQNTIYDVAKSNNVRPRDFFKVLYQIILGDDSGAEDRPVHIGCGKKTGCRADLRTRIGMAHSEHNRSRNSGGFALIILGALLLFLAPNIHPQMPDLGLASLVGGVVIGGIGFYLKFVMGRTRTNRG